mmetsp:Transcript_38135/g.76431  ORF Transcript_38135/g.76431 Transcript_38135/m.76431 type:complete len:80 (-) Transcript_38135:471-710(-)
MGSPRIASLGRSFPYTLHVSTLLLYKGSLLGLCYAKSLFCVEERDRQANCFLIEVFIFALQLTHVFVSEVLAQCCICRT